MVGRVPLHTLKADIDYGTAEARTTLGRIGVKTWIYKGDRVHERQPPPQPAASPEAQEAAAPAEVATSGEERQPVEAPAGGEET